MSRRILTAVTLAMVAAAGWAAVSATPPVWLSPLTWLGMLWLPGTLAWGWGAGRAPADSRPAHLFETCESIWMPLAFGPAIFGALLCLGRRFSLPLPVAALLPVVLGAAWLVLRLNRPGGVQRRDAPTPAAGARLALDADRRPGASSPLPLVAGAVVLLLGALPPLLFEPLRFRADALLHLPIIERALAGSFPPENPFMAGEPLGYFWFYHVCVAGIVRLTGLPVDLVPALLNAQALALLLLVLDRTGRKFGLSPAARAITLFLIGFGLSPLGWIRWLIATGIRHAVDWEMVRQSGLAALFPVLSPEDPRLAGFLTKIAVTNAFPMSLPLFALALAPDAATGQGDRVRQALAVAGAILFHMATGVLLVAGLGVRWLAALLVRSTAPQLRKWRGAGELIALAAGVLVTVPYLLNVLGGRREGSGFAPAWSGGTAIKLQVSLAGIWLVMAVGGSLALRRRGRPGNLAEAGWLPIYLAAGIPALVLPFLGSFVGGNEYKSVFLLLVLLAPVAAGFLGALGRRSAPLLALILLLFAPTPFLIAGGYSMEKLPPALARERRIEMARLAADLPPDAVLWQPDPGQTYNPLAVTLKRAFYLTDPMTLHYLGQWEGAEAKSRRRSLEDARAGNLSEALREAKARVAGRPVFVVLGGPGSAETARIEGMLGRIQAPQIGGTNLLRIYRLP